MARLGEAAVIGKPLLRGIDEFEAAWIVAFVEWCVVGGDEDLQGGIDPGLEEMTARCGSVLFPQDNVGVNDRPALERGDVADHGEDLDLLVDRQRVVEFAIQIEPCGEGAGDCSYAGEVRVTYVISTTFVNKRPKSRS
ncbi:hypothetical protein HDF13_002630 [Edaphobacter lichenicola]|uniref:Uncharacterized protein n=1 Tax=Tunturiibacter gelidiferens TaxID=3069689 RepID=A0ACC5P0F3_9BACT|nr:hypothetical protein [Edaphobacter lichenicola]MBB5340297.1 hypothetical protein [Edaphobacter lichenicola]